MGLEPSRNPVCAQPLSSFGMGSLQSPKSAEVTRYFGKDSHHCLKNCKNVTEEVLEEIRSAVPITSSLLSCIQLKFFNQEVLGPAAMICLGLRSVLAAGIDVVQKFCLQRNESCM